MTIRTSSGRNLVAGCYADLHHLHRFSVANIGYANFLDHDASLDQSRVGFIRVDAQIFTSLAHRLYRKLLPIGQALSAASVTKRRSTSKKCRNSSRVSLRPKPSVPRTTIGCIDFGTDQPGQRLHVVAGSHHWRIPCQQFGNVTPPRLLRGVQQIPARHILTLLDPARRSWSR